MMKRISSGNMFGRNGSFAYCFAGGGTGGHMFPGIAVAKEIQKRDSGAEIVFISTGRDLEGRLLERLDCRTESLPAAPFTIKPWKIHELLWRTFEGVRRATRVLRKRRVGAVIGLGGYGSIAPAIAARRMRIPLFLLEQNAVPGKANRLSSLWAHSVFVQWESAARMFSGKARVINAGNPTQRLRRNDVFKPYPHFGLTPWRRTLLIMGGSQGALGLNRKIYEAIPILKKFAHDIQIIHLTGGKGNAELVKAYGDSNIRAVVKPFIHEMTKAYAVADLVISRAGGTSISEITSLGLPAILVPFPAAAHNHQVLNAAEMAKAGAALVIEEHELAPEMLAKVIAGTLYSPAALRAMKRASRSLGRPNAVRVIVDHIEEVFGIQARRLARAG
ncbi:MAG: undecaprenyldiphospho-muramoylpentapeptide beta-N-acetylglucosaminyltransferase [Planctomycetota bacterium]|jgi:UDP-N-acetylglucosamine--N-acetylmuramyl-(pentapeptide) pyrophosphoryl-undecaprenol N-acetylglucosamine transferase